MANKTKPAKAKTHRNPKGRVAFFCYVKTKTLKTIKVARENRSSQGEVIDTWASLWNCANGPEKPVARSYKRPIA